LLFDFKFAAYAGTLEVFMTMIIQCPTCRARFKVAASVVGKLAKCSRCQNSWTIAKTDVLAPDKVQSEMQKKVMEGSATGTTNQVGHQSVAVQLPTQSAQVAASVVAVKGPGKPGKVDLSNAVPIKQRLETIDAAFGSEFRPPGAGIGYRLATVLAAFFMLLLPLLYLAMIGLVIAAICYHAVYSVALFEHVRGRGIFAALAIYIFPLLAGSLCVFFMFKPLFVRRARVVRERSITRGGEPLLFALVDKICKVVKAPRPRQINIDADVNASASFRNGIWSLFRRGDLTLTIGAPLAAGLTANQFVGILAHEFGHFSQGGGMKMTFIVRSINHWFARLVYERDEWDQWLADQINDEESDFRIKLVFFLSQVFVYLTRAVLWCFMMIGHVGCCILLRQMEYHADMFEIRLCGSKNFEQTTRRITELGIASQVAQYALIQEFVKGKRIEDIPATIVENADKLNREQEKTVKKMLESEPTGILDTHPSSKDRIAAARRINAEGVFDLDVPASVLFQHFDAITKNVTADIYRSLR
jgi:predicted Zn finger-like uncharacterized protein